MTKSKFSKPIADDLLVRSGRRCCLCQEKKGGKVQVHHIILASEGGPATADNGIVLCLDCHSEVHAYSGAAPIGRNFSPSELKRHRDQWFDIFARTGGVAPTAADIAEELLKKFIQEMPPPPGTKSPDLGQLAAQATERTDQLLREAIDLQRQNKERAAIERLLTAYDMELPAPAKVQLHLLVGGSYYRLSEYAKAEGHYREALDASRGTTREGEAGAIGNLAVICQDRGDLDAAERYYRDALAIDREIADRAMEANHLGNLAYISLSRGDASSAAAFLQDAIAVNRQVGNREAEAIQLGNLGIVYGNSGELDQAEQLFKDALAIEREIHNRLGEASQLGNLGNIHKDRRDLEGAEAFFEGALAIEREIGDRFGEATSLANLALIAEGREDLSRACSLLRDACTIFDAIGAGGPNFELARAKLKELGCEENDKEA